METRLGVKTADLLQPELVSPTKPTPIGSEAFLSLTGGMSAMLHEFLLAQFVPIHLVGRSKQKQMGQRENLRSTQQQTAPLCPTMCLPRGSEASSFLFPSYVPTRNCTQVLTNQPLAGVWGFALFL